MLDPNIFKNINDENINKFKSRGVSSEKIHEICFQQKKVKEIKNKIEIIQSEKNKLAKEFGISKLHKNTNSKEISTLQKKMVNCKNELAKLDDEYKNLKEKYEENLISLPNIPLDDVPFGIDEKANKEIKKYGTIKKFDFTPLNHWEIGLKQKIFDFNRAAKISGSRFVIYQGLGAKLIRALQNFTLKSHEDAGFYEILPPVIVNERAFFCTGQFPKFVDDVFKIEKTNLFLSSTSEVQLVNYFQNEILDEDQLPIKVMANTNNFRSEAGNAGRDTKGIIRLHQFFKTEMVIICKAEDAVKYQQHLVDEATKILEQLKLPYRQVILSTGDMGISSQRTYDIEVWMPGANQYREISSISTCGTYQSRRGMIRYKNNKTKSNEYVATLNGSGVAIDRLLAAIIENYQTKDKNFVIPDVLKGFLNC